MQSNKNEKELSEKLKNELNQKLRFLNSVKIYINPKEVGKLPSTNGSLSPDEEMCELYVEFKTEYENGLKKINNLIATYDLSQYYIYSFLNENNDNIDKISFDNIKEECLLYYENLNKILNKIIDTTKQDTNYKILGFEN